MTERWRQIGELIEICALPAIFFVAALLLIFGPDDFHRAAGLGFTIVGMLYRIALALEKAND